MDLTPLIGLKKSRSSTTGYPQYILAELLNTVFPIKCIQCGKFSNERRKEYLCLKCLKDIPVKKKFECIGCSASSPLGTTCFECRNTNLINNLFIVSDYTNDLTVKIIKLLKYRLIKEMIGPIEFAVKKYISYLNSAKGFNILEEDPLIIPVPLYYRRLNWRGFNQAELIAKSLADLLHINFEPEILARIKSSKHQADIKNRQERLANSMGLYKIRAPEKIKNRTVILVDDVCTTGATLNECGRILKEAGANKVIGLVFARG